MLLLSKHITQIVKKTNYIKWHQDKIHNGIREDKEDVDVDVVEDVGGRDVNIRSGRRSLLKRDQPERNVRLLLAQVNGLRGRKHAIHMVHIQQGNPLILISFPRLRLLMPNKVLMKRCHFYN